MNGTYKRGRRYCALALSVLGCAYLAVAPLSALAQSAGGRGVSVTVNPTTGYAVINSSTVGTPRGTTIGPSGGPPSVNVRPPGAGGGLSQSLPAGIEITGIRQNAQTLRGPLGATVNASLGAVRNAAVRCLTSFRCNTALGAGALGLQALLDGVGWIMDEGGRPMKRGELEIDGEGSDSAWRFSHNPNAFGSQYEYAGTDCPAVVSFGPGTFSCSTRWKYLGSYYAPTGHITTITREINRSSSASVQDIQGCVFNSVCRNTAVYRKESNVSLSEAPPSLLTPSEIEDQIDNYNPQPSDWSWLTGGMNWSSPDVNIDITDVPVLDGSNEPNFIEWSDGTSRGTFNVYTPTVTNNASHKPDISVKDEQTEITYDDQGNPTGSSTSTTVTPPSTSTGGGGAPAAEVPTDCDFMPTVCRFIDWFTEPEPLPDPDQEIRDLVQVYEDGGRTVDLGPSMGSCPPPRVIALSFVPAVEVSFQPFCDLAAAVRLWLLAIAYFGAAYLTVRSI